MKSVCLTQLGAHCISEEEDIVKMVPDRSVSEVIVLNAAIIDGKLFPRLAVLITSWFPLVVFARMSSTDLSTLVLKLLGMVMLLVVGPL